MKFYHLLSIISIVSVTCIQDLVLVDAENGQDVLILQDGMVFEEVELPRTMTIRAIPHENENIVRFDLDHGLSIRVEEIPPFVLAGKDGETLCPSHQLRRIGSHTISVQEITKVVTPELKESVRNLMKKGSLSISITLHIVEALEDGIVAAANNEQAIIAVPNGTITYDHLTAAIYFQGPIASLTSTTDPVPILRSGSPFADYKLELNFDGMTVPCYFAASPNATAGSDWKCHVRLSTSSQEYNVSFSHGANVAVTNAATASSAGFMDGRSGTLQNTRDSVPYIISDTMQFVGLASPNLLDPSVTVSSLKELRSKGVNALTIRPIDNDLSPYVNQNVTDHDVRYYFDTRKLEVWRKKLQRAADLGFVLRIQIKDTDDELLDRLLVREMVARFAHVGPIVWDVSSNILQDAVREMDPYQHAMAESSRWFIETDTIADLLTPPIRNGFFWKANSDAISVDWDMLRTAHGLVSLADAVWTTSAVRARPKSIYAVDYIPLDTSDGVPVLSANVTTNAQGEITSPGMIDPSLDWIIVLTMIGE